MVQLKKPGPYEMLTEVRKVAPHPQTSQEI
jgi:hypothetical protein